MTHLLNPHPYVSYLFILLIARQQITTLHNSAAIILIGAMYQMEGKEGKRKMRAEAKTKANHENLG